MNTSELLQLYDAEVRGWTGIPSPGFLIVRDGPVVRLVGPGPEPHANAVLLATLAEADVDAVIAREIEFFRALGHAFEWKHFSHDRPGTLDQKLRAAGFRPQEQETFVALDVSQAFDFDALPDGVEVRHLEDPASLRTIAEVNGAVYGDPGDAEWLAETISKEKQADPDQIQIYAAYVGGKPISVGWMRYKRRDAFGSLWGGSTLPEWRGKGVYSALVATRAREARARGCRWLTVDCSSMSLPILERRGFKPLSVITPFIWSPDPA